MSEKYSNEEMQKVYKLRQWVAKNKKQERESGWELLALLRLKLRWCSLGGKVRPGEGSICRQLSHCQHIFRASSSIVSWPFKWGARVLLELEAGIVFRIEVIVEVWGGRNWRKGTKHHPSLYTWHLHTDHLYGLEGLALTGRYCQDPNTKSSLLWSNRSTIHYPSFILGYNYYYSPYFSLLTSFHSIPFWSVCSLVLFINIITLGSSSINYDFILTSYYPSNRCFTQKLSIPDYNIVISFFIILYMFHSYLCRYIILSFVLCILVFENQLSFSHSSLVIISWISSSILLEISILYFWRVGWHST